MGLDKESRHKRLPSAGLTLCCVSLLLLASSVQAHSPAQPAATSHHRQRSHSLHHRRADPLSVAAASSDLAHRNEFHPRATDEFDTRFDIALNQDFVSGHGDDNSATDGYEAAARSDFSDFERDEVIGKGFAVPAGHLLGHNNRRTIPGANLLAVKSSLATPAGKPGDYNDVDQVSNARLTPASGPASLSTISTLVDSHMSPSETPIGLSAVAKPPKPVDADGEGHVALSTHASTNVDGEVTSLLSTSLGGKSGPAPFPSAPNGVRPSKFWGSTSGPLPTNSWWLNLVLNEGDQPIAPYPYLVRPLDSGATLMSPTTEIHENYVAMTPVGNWVLSSTEGFNARQLLAYDDLTATYGWTNNAGGSMKSTFVKGSPYLTFIVNGLTLNLTTIHAVLDLKQDGGAGRTIVTLNNTQVWAIYHDQPLNLSKRVNSDNTTSLIASGKYSGVIRLAMSSNPASLEVLHKFSATYVTGATTKFEYQSSQDFDLKYSFLTAGGDASGLLMLALDHHNDILVDTPRQSISGFACIKGPMTGVLGAQWTLRQTLNAIQWHAPHPVRAQDLPKLHQHLEADIAKGMSIAASDPYFFGKGLARIARLALIADHAGRQDLVNKVITPLKALIAPWLAGTNSDPLTYDTVWKGICSRAGLSDTGAAFGNGVYNDHHFHYGYFVYAAATIGKYDSEWIQANRDPILALVRDYANPSHSDTYFPFLRHMDLFDGHSWASGLFPFGDGRNQESTSESVNAYYALYLLGLSLKDAELARFGNALLSMEIRSSQAYWHMTTKKSVYPAPFANHKVVGILWSTKVDYATWFGANTEFISGIQALPFTPVSATLLDREWVQEAYPVIKSAITRPDPPITDGWKEFMYMFHAIIDKDAAIAELATIKDHDDGNTASNALYWASTV
ncbi:hypothetical protein IWQ60_007395 [Tieghemiomyces parasiticus]|uniref:glucan endo-1,3-beta-D-glucosidase n=1 Tax=Tieghemiomyces parasiticus TaxID=78921 RepID=A0A9W8A1E8_9FUNG|nr:hypothetical protein IWQ60_007395 [Tieghemiomyces parasiticus]